MRFKCKPMQVLSLSLYFLRRNNNKLWAIINHQVWWGCSWGEVQLHTSPSAMEDLPREEQVIHNWSWWWSRFQAPSLAEVSPHLAEHCLYSNPRMTEGLFSSCRGGRWERAHPISFLVTLHHCLFKLCWHGCSNLLEIPRTVTGSYTCQLSQELPHRTPVCFDRGTRMSWECLQWARTQLRTGQAFFYSSWHPEPIWGNHLSPQILHSRQDWRHCRLSLPFLWRFLSGPEVEWVGEVLIAEAGTAASLSALGVYWGLALLPGCPL